MIRLECPECSGRLNLRRVHLGVAGKCVHCTAPITAVEEGGVVLVKRSCDLLSRRPDSPISTTTVSDPVEEASSYPVPPPLSPQDSVSTRGSPGRDEKSGDTVGDSLSAEAEITNVPAGFSKHEAANGAGPASPQNFHVSEISSEEIPSSPPSLAGEGEIVSEEVESGERFETGKEAGTGEKPGTGFGFSATPKDELIDGGLAEESSSEMTTFAGPEDFSDLFETKSDFASSPLFSTSSHEVSSGWGTKVPDQKHASISPFSTGSAEPDPGFAETLFREKAMENTANIQPRSPFIEFDANQNSTPSPDALFGSLSGPAEPATSEHEAVLDGAARPLREMTPEEPKRSPQDVMHLGDSRKGSSPLKRIAKLVTTIVLLGGIGLGAYVFLPQEKGGEVKAKIIEWIESGSVLMQYLPFEIGSSEGGETGSSAAIPQGLPDLSEEMDNDPATAESPLQRTPSGGAASYRQENPVDMPESPAARMPDMDPGDITLQ